MGSFSHKTFADYPILSYKNWYYEQIVNSIFLPSDFIIEKRALSSRNKVVWSNGYENEEGNYEFFGYKQTVKVCRERLEIYGVSSKKAKSNFNMAKKISVQEEIYDIHLKDLTYEQYLTEIKSIIETKDKRHNEYYYNFREFLIEEEFAIYGQSIESHLYSILQVLPQDAIVEYDLTDIILDGSLDINNAKSVDYEKIIIHTEGKTDVEFISKSIEKLFPYLKDYYHFIDFEEYKVKIESNASALVRLATSFAAAKVKHPIIVLFDNDTTGLKEMKKLTSMILPSNIKVLKYPNISLAKKYPTIGPTGKKIMNINGYACSIEMYFGIDVLTKDNELIPIQWKGYEDSEKKYQGEISDKNYVQETFRKKLKSIYMTETDELMQLLNTIFEAFT